MKKKIIIILGIILGAIALRYAYTSVIGIIKSKSKNTKIMPEVKVETVKNENIIREIETPGRIESKYQVSVIARVSGYLEKSYFKEGDFVKNGDILFLIEPAQYEYAANSASASVKNIKAQLEYANKQLLRAKELVAKDYIAKSKYDEILSTRDSLAAQLEEAKSNYKDSNRNLNYTQIKAPVDGRIGFIDVTIGNYVTPSTGSLTTINSTNPIYVVYSINSKDYKELTKIDKDKNENRKTEIYFSNGEKYELTGIQDFVDNKVDQTTGSVTLRSTFKNPDNRLLHGEFVKVKIYSNNKVLTPVIPTAAVQENQEGKYVYKLDSEDIPSLTYIKTGGQSGDNWIVTDGLEVGDRIITEGVLKVIPGNKVKVIK